MRNINIKKHSFSCLVGKLFGIKKTTMNILEEEAIQSPLRNVVNSFISNKLAMGGLIVFCIIFLTVIIGPLFYPIDLSEQEETQINIPPCNNLMKVPSALKGRIKQISTGSTFSTGIDEDGKVYVWGNTKISNTIDLMKDKPSQKELGKVVSIAAGFDHIIALNDKGEIICWGNNRMGQCKLPAEVVNQKGIIQIAAGYQVSYALDDKGNVYYWGNENLNDIRCTKKKGNGHISKIVVSNMTLMGVKEDGTVVHMGAQQSEVDNIPEDLKGVKDLASTDHTCLAVLDDGSVRVWGKQSKLISDIPQFDSAVKTVIGGKNHYTALTESGQVYAWGENNEHQIEVPKSLHKVLAIYGGTYQNYAITDNHKVVTWGLKGYLLGTDDLGRDVFTRLLNGGRMTMTIGAIAVIISTIIGIIVGGISGFFGGWIDIVLQRLTEIVSSLPFLPMAMILSSIIGNKLSENAKIILIMIILGVLSWPSLARLVRAQVLSEREQEFVTAANAMGVKKSKIVFMHIIPNVVSVIIVSATLDFASCMLTESTLSFLGFGVKLPRPTWGNMLNGCVSSIVIKNYWWRWAFPAMMLAICVICINMVGDGLRDAIDPKSNEQ